MNQQDLVPPLELCQKIPKGEFKNTYFSYLYCSFCIGYEIVKTENVNSINSYPAPTLQEILAELKGFEMIGNTCYSIMKGHVIANGRNVVECALRLWLENKGINKK